MRDQKMIASKMKNYPGNGANREEGWISDCLVVGGELVRMLLLILLQQGQFRATTYDEKQKNQRETTIISIAIFLTIFNNKILAGNSQFHKIYLSVRSPMQTAKQRKCSRTRVPWGVSSTTTLL